MGVTAIVLAAGEGTRMKSSRPKVVHEVLGKSMVQWVVDAARTAGVDRCVVVVGNGAEQVEALFAGDADVECVLQEQRLGTGHAVRAALEKTQVEDGQVLVLCGDTPLLRAETLKSLVDAAMSPAHEAGALLTMTYDDPTGYGRVMVAEDGCATAIVEQKDCTAEQALVKTCNAGVYCFDAELLRAHISELTCENAQNEYYLTDMVGILRAHGAAMAAVDCPDAVELMGVNSRIQLAQASRAMQERINLTHMAAGVTMLDPTQVWIGPDVTIGRDTEILPGTMLWGDTHIGENCVVGPQTRLTDTRVGSGCVVDETVAVQAVIDNDVECGAPTCVPAPICATAPRRARTWRSRSPRWARVRRCRTSPTSATVPSARASTSVRVPLPATMTARTRTPPLSATARSSARTPCLWPPSTSAAVARWAPVPPSPATCPTAPLRWSAPNKR